LNIEKDSLNTSNNGNIEHFYIMKHPGIVKAYSEAFDKLQALATPAAQHPIGANVERGLTCNGLCSMGSSMSLEITRKLDPNAHPALKTYLVMYGPVKTFALTLVFVVLSAIGAHLLGLEKILWPLEALVVVGASTVFWKPSAFKAVEGLSALSSLIHLFGIAIAHWAGLAPSVHP
jgi:hypothetical protein